MRLTRNIKALCLIGVILFIPARFAPASNAQQTIFNVPSAEVTPKHTLYLEHESQFGAWEPNRFWLGTHYAAVGIGANTEIDTTLSNLSTPLSDNIVLGVGFKTSVPLLKQQLPNRELKLTVGNLTPVSLQGQGVGNWSYAHVSGRLPKLKTRLTAGYTAGTRQLFGRNTVGAIAGYEQPLTKQLSLIGDWFSGTHNNGYFIPGFSYVLKDATTLYVGYQIPNSRRVGPSGFVVEISTLLPLPKAKKP